MYLLQSFLRQLISEHLQPQTKLIVIDMNYYFLQFDNYCLHLSVGLLTVFITTQFTECSANVPSESNQCDTWRNLKFWTPTLGPSEPSASGRIHELPVPNSSKLTRINQLVEYSTYFNIMIAFGRYRTIVELLDDGAQPPYIFSIINLDRFGRFWS